MPEFRRSRSPHRRKDEPSTSRRHDGSSRRYRSHSRSPPQRDHERGRRNPTPDQSSRRRDHSRSHSPSSRRKRYASRSRSHSRNRGDRRDHRRKRARSRSSSSSSDSDDSRSRRKKDRKKDKKRSGSKERRKREKKEKKKKEKKRSANTSHWGKYGILTDTDIFTKQGEFHAWLVEERKVNPETITKDQERKEFSRFIEDYNTATLPHEKYYNMEAYDKRMNALRQGEYLPPTDDIYDFEADVKAVKSAHKKKPAEQESYLSREELMELRRVQQERTELGKMKLLGMDIKSTYGVRMDKADFDE